MVTGWMLFTGTDTKGRRLLYIKKKNAYYLLPQHREFAITLWKHAEINAISISIILGYFLFHKIAGTIALALVLYAVEPVSYTHLDVYKRQRLFRTLLKPIKQSVFLFIIKRLIN